MDMFRQIIGIWLSGLQENKADGSFHDGRHPTCQEGKRRWVADVAMARRFAGVG